MTDATIGLTLRRKVHFRTVSHPLPTLPSMPILTQPSRFLLVATALYTLALAGALAAVQQAERQRADEPQVQMAEDAALAMSHGEDPQHVVPRSATPADRSLAPFGILLDDSGQLRGASAPFTGTIPVPPRGVIEHARRQGESRITWRPTPSLRLAAVVVKVTGGPGGFVVVARSLRETEARITRIARLLGVIWLVGLLLLGGLALASARRTPASH